MTDRQLDTLLRMIHMILDGCKDLDEAKEKVEELLEDQHAKKRTEAKAGHCCPASCFPVFRAN